MTAGGRKSCLGVILGAHGVRGAFKIRTFTADPVSVAAYGPVTDEAGRRILTLKVARTLADGVVLASAPEVPTREDAMALGGVAVYVDRDRLPPPEDPDEVYLDDLVGLAAADETGAPLGTVVAVFNFGAGDLLELADAPGRKGRTLVPFTKAAVPDIDLAAGRITIARAALPGA